MAACLFAFNLVILYIAPPVILPMFFACKRLPQGLLYKRLMGLAQTMGIRLLDIYNIDFSSRTTKANAGLTGIGNTRRVVLSDTLQKAFTEDEIVALVAHEFAHSKKCHLPKMIFISSLLAAVFFFIAFRLSPLLLSWLGIRSLTDPAAIPVILLAVYLAGIISQPFLNAVSRRFEFEADAAAIEATASSQAWISAMEKLAANNLSDPSPAAIMVWLFYSHPPVSRRIAFARAWQAPEML